MNIFLLVAGIIHVASLPSSTTLGLFGSGVSTAVDDDVNTNLSTVELFAAAARTFCVARTTHGMTSSGFELKVKSEA